MRLICCGYGVKTFERIHKEGKFPSTLLYGVAEMQEDGLDAGMYQLTKTNDKLGILKDLYHLWFDDYDVLYLPYIREKVVMIVLFLKYLHLYRKKAIGILHKTPDIGSGTKAWFLKTVYNQIDHIFFHSQKNMDECVAMRIVKPGTCSMLNWGVDLPFYENIEAKGSYDFVSTGMENRDFATLIEAFKDSDANLSLYVPEAQKGNEIFKGIETSPEPNITLSYVHQTDETIKELAAVVRASRAVVVPVLPLALNYCVGHTSIVEAMALGRPLIVTDNPYHPVDVEKEGVGVKYTAGDAASLRKAVEYIQQHPEEAEEMGRKGRILAEKKYNVRACEQQILETLNWKK